MLKNNSKYIEPLVVAYWTLLTSKCVYCNLDNQLFYTFLQLEQNWSCKLSYCSCQGPIISHLIGWSLVSLTTIEKLGLYSHSINTIEMLWMGKRNILYSRIETYLWDVWHFIPFKLFCWLVEHILFCCPNRIGVVNLITAPVKIQVW